MQMSQTYYTNNKSFSENSNLINQGSNDRTNSLNDLFIETLILVHPSRTYFFFMWSTIALVYYIISNAKS